MYSGTRTIARDLGLTDPVACIDGSHIVDLTTNRQLASSPLTGGGVSALLEELDQHQPAAFVFSGDRVYFDDPGRGYLPYVATWSEEKEELSAVLDPSHWHAERPIAALVALGTEAQIGGVHEAIRLRHESLLQSVCFPVRHAAHEGVWGMVVRAAKVDKGTAIEWLASHYGITPEEIVVVGDWLNDIPMLKRAGRSFAMAQAPDEVKAAATDVLEADIWRGGGLAEAAVRSGLL
jgi:HAD superfamily hydrolase (TIGR01484 family)